MKSAIHLHSETKLQHILDIKHLPSQLLIKLMDKAQEYINAKSHLSHNLDTLKHQTIAHLFFEPSTRTRVSFELAAKRLGADIVNIEANVSSLQKSESVLDTIITLTAMHCHIFVIRHHQNQFINDIARQVPPEISVINAGDGTRAHPTQALLDMLTIRQFKNDFNQLKVAIVGDIYHSRVAHSQIAALHKLNVKEIRLIGPEHLLPKTGEIAEVKHFTVLEQGLEDVDVVIVLRLQKERFQQDHITDLKQYYNQYGITETKLARAKSNAIIMHPGPINRHVEIDPEVAYGPNSVIMKQVSNGIAMRMAIMSSLFESHLPNL